MRTLRTKLSRKFKYLLRTWSTTISSQVCLFRVIFCIWKALIILNSKEKFCDCYVIKEKRKIIIISSEEKITTFYILMSETIFLLSRSLFKERALFRQPLQQSFRFSCCNYLMKVFDVFRMLQDNRNNPENEMKLT